MSSFETVNRDNKNNQHHHSTNTSTKSSSQSYQIKSPTQQQQQQQQQVESNGNSNVNKNYISCSPDLNPVHPAVKSIYGGQSLLSSSLKSHGFYHKDQSLSSTQSSPSQLSSSHEDRSELKESVSLPQSFKSSTINQNEVKNILSNHIDSREKEIERLTRIAEKDKLDSINYLNHIKGHKKTLSGYIRDFYGDGDNSERKEHIEKSAVLSAIEGTVPNSPFLPNSPVSYVHSPTLVNSSSTVVPSPILNDRATAEKNEIIQSISFWDTASTQQQHEDGKELSQKDSVSKLVSSFHTKDEELERVRSRTTTESMKAQYLREKCEVLSHLVSSEKENWGLEIDRLRKEVHTKEKDICRLLMVAETQKKSSMEFIDQITKLKRSLSSISQLRGNSCLVDIHRVNERFSFESLSSSPTPSSLGSSYGSNHGNGSHQHHHHNSLTSSPHSKSFSPVQTSPKQDPSSSSSIDKTLTEEKKEIIALRKLNVKKDDEIKRIKEIIEYEIMKTNFLSNKVTELKTMLEEESRQVDSLQLKSYKEMKEKEEAIQKVAMRALKERMKADQLREEIKRLSKELKGDDYKKKNYDVVAFTEMGDLTQFQNLSLSPYCNEQTQVKPQKPKLSINSSILSNVNSNHFNHNNNNIHFNYNNNNNNNNHNHIQHSNGNSSNNHHHHNNHHNNNINIPTSPTPFINEQQQSHTSSSIKIPHSSIARRNSVTSSPGSGFVHQHNRSNSSQIINSMNQSTSHVIVGSPTEIINMKLQEIERNCKVANQKDVELAKIKKIAEAERSRFTLLKEKFLELKNDISVENDYGCGKYTAKIY